MKQECLHAESVSVSAFVRSSVESKFFNPIFLINSLLLVVCALGLAYFVMGSNSIAANEYRVTALRNQGAQLTQQQSLLAAEKSSAEDPAAADQYAQSAGMVSAQDIVYVFENGNVALRQ